jgi:hypothetical protein
MNAISDSDPFKLETPKHGDVFKIIAVLSLCWSGLMFLGALPGALSNPSANETQEAIAQMQQLNPKWAELLRILNEAQGSTFQNLYAWINVLSAGLSFTGVFLMWRFKLYGLWLYTAGELLPYTLFLNSQLITGLQSIGGSGNGALFFAMLSMLVCDSFFVFLFRKQLLAALHKV